MGWLGRLFGRKQGERKQGGAPERPADAAPLVADPALVSAPPDPGPAEAEAPSSDAPAALPPDILAEIEELAMPAIRLLPQPGAPVPEAPVSSLGGRPSLPEGMDWPEDDGRPMLFLAQINYAEMPPLEGYPTSGLLSVFVAEGETHGCAFPSLDQAGFRSLYLEDPTTCQRRDPPDAPQGPDPLGATLRAEGAVLTGEAVHDLPGAALREAAALQKGWAEAGREVDEAALDRVLEAGRAGAITYGGYPVFAQGDVRTGRQRFHAKVLLQLGRLGAGDRAVSFGDGGAANVLIKPKDLGPRRFDQALYHYDSY
ncbi:DUF1963 domain-containing protein [Ferrimonas balearica]|nr:DUF1963 domain-containing protein [Ferrimonas balearica]